MIDANSFVSTNVKSEGDNRPNAQSGGNFNVRMPIRKDDEHDGIIPSIFRLESVQSLNEPPKDFPMKLIRNGLSDKTNVEESWDPIDQNDEFKPILVNEMRELEKLDVLKDPDTDQEISIWRCKKTTGYFRIGDMLSLGDRHPDIGNGYYFYFMVKKIVKKS